MSKWHKTGTFTAPPIPTVDDTIDRRGSGYERIRAKATYNEPRASTVETYAQRQARLAKRRGLCPKCEAVTGERCLDLDALPTRRFAAGFHKLRPMLPPPAPVTPMVRITPGRTVCKCGHTARYHVMHEGKCSECRCRKLKES